MTGLIEGFANMRITVAGAGYVGLSLSVLLSSLAGASGGLVSDVVLYDIDPDRTALVNRGLSPIKDAGIEARLAQGIDALRATTDAQSAFTSADMVFIATPTNYDEDRNFFDTSSIEAVLELVCRYTRGVTVVVKSTVPVGYTEELAARFQDVTVLFSPEFLREGHALEDNLHPSRIIVGAPQYDASRRGSQYGRAAENVIALLRSASLDRNVPVIKMRSTEAEAVKLFANSYLALRVAYFNELDTYARIKGLDSRAIIEGVGYDRRIGDYYNNPSFGYGGYCLPKDSKQLLANYRDVPQKMIEAIVAANRVRMDFVADEITRRVLNALRCTTGIPVVGVYRLAMKAGSDNFRSSSIVGVLERLRDRGLSVLIFEPSISTSSFDGCEVTNDFESFVSRSTVIATNRFDEQLKLFTDKVYTADVFGRD